MSSRYLIFALCGLSFLAGVDSYGQAVNATLLGTVTDVTGGVIVNGRVTISEVNTGVDRYGQTNESGNYSFLNLPPGQYAVTVEAVGFKRETRRDIDLIVNSSTRVDIRLDPGNVTESIEVTGAPPLLQTDRADTGVKIEAVQTASLPLGVNRNYQTLLNLVPGTTRATFQGSQFLDGASSVQTEVYGQDRHGNDYLIEGLENSSGTGGFQIVVTPAEAIQTVDVSTSNYEAEFGRAVGAVTNVILKSGTNSFHGAAYEFLQNSDLNARSFFSPSVGHLAYNYFGGNLGGPIRKNKIFFFGDYLKVLDHEAYPNVGTIPSTAFRGGDLSAAPTAIYNPFSGNPDGSGRTPFPSNHVPASLINPVSAKILALIPAPNQVFNESSPSNNYFASVPFTKDSDSVDVKMDDNISDKNRLSGRFSFSRPITYQAPIFGMAGGWAPTSNGGFQGRGILKNYSSGVTYDRIFSPSLLAEFRAGVTHYHSDALNIDYGTPASSNIGIPGVNLDDWTSGLVGITINGGFSNPTVGYSGSLPWHRAEAIFSVVNIWTKTLGNHTVKWGVDFRRNRDDLLQASNFSPRGVYTFSEAQTSIPGGKTGFGNDFASFLLDQPSQVGRDLAIYFPAYRSTWLFGFVQDKWVATSKLTLDLGMRWELYLPGTPRFPGGFSNYDPVKNQLVLAGIGGNPMNMGMETRYRYFAPRFGAAYRLTGATALRAGFGMSYMNSLAGDSYAYNFPVKQSNNYLPAGNGYGPAILSNGQSATFQAGFPPPAAAVIPSNGIITNPDPTQNYSVYPLDYKNPYVEFWNLSVQQALPAHFTLDVAYVGNHGVDTMVGENINAATVIGRGTQGQPEYPRTATTSENVPLSTSYNALHVKLDRRFTSGLRITTAYTWGKGMGFGTLFYVNPHRNWGTTSFNRLHTFVQSYVYDLPVGNGKRWLNAGPAAAVLGGWQVNGVMTLMTGTPFTITYSATGLNAPGNTQTADQIAPIQILHGINTGNPWFSTSSFAAPAALTFGNTGRDYMTGPGFFNLDFSIFRNISLTERMKAQLRGEAFNVTNTPQFSSPASTLGSASFGYITSVITSGSGANGVGGGRGVQLGVKLTF